MNARTIHHSALRACPHFIWSPEHYREDETCRCDDPTATVMAEWGYTWNEETGRWES